MKIYVITEYDTDFGTNGSSHDVLSAWFNEEDALSECDRLDALTSYSEHKVTEAELHGSVEPRLKVEVKAIKE